MAVRAALLLYYGSDYSMHAPRKGESGVGWWIGDVGIVDRLGLDVDGGGESQAAAKDVD
jgi:hypothetical protein